MSKSKLSFLLKLFFGLLSFICLSSCSNNTQQEGIKIYSDNKFYWEYKGEPTLLIGGTKDDNLFQIEDLRSHLELLKSVGGNYVRCTMSSRDDNNEKPYLKNEEGLFDLDNLNPVYWNLLDSLLHFCNELDIIVQIEIWATYDFYWGDAAWAKNPFNPMLNSSYSSKTSGLPDSITLPAQSESSPFFKTIPELENNELVLNYQKKFVDKLLSISLRYNNVLYSIDNETTAHYAWGKYWAKYLSEKAEKIGKDIFITEMWDCWDPTGGEVEDAIVQDPKLGDWYATYQNPDIHKTANFSYALKDTLSYQFLDVSNNNSQKGETHYQTALWVREAVLKSGKIRPINNVKIYGGYRDNIWAGNIKDGKERFWRDVFAGHAAVRFHRPPAGIGLNDVAQNQIKSLRMLTNNVDFFKLSPNNKILLEREENEAFCLANKENSEILVYFPDSGSVKIEVSQGKYAISKMNISSSTWEDTENIELPGIVENISGEDCAFVLKLIEE